MVPDDLCVTKRVVLRCIARVFDPWDLELHFLWRLRPCFKISGK